MRSKTYSLKASDIQRAWWVVDVGGRTLGRVASQIATVLMGKGKPTYAPHLEVGDFVVVVNAELVRTTGKKLRDKIYYRHTGYPGGIKSVTLGKLLAEHPDRVIMKAVQGMLPKNKLGRHALKRLHVYRGKEHPHAGQVPQLLDLGGESG